MSDIPPIDPMYIIFGSFFYWSIFWRTFKLTFFLHFERRSLKRINEVPYLFSANHMYNVYMSCNPLIKTPSDPAVDDRETDK